LIHWSQEADVVHTHLWGGEFWGGISARMAGKPVVTTVHNTRGDGRIRDTLLSLFGPRDACHVGVSPACVEFSMKGGRSGDRRVIFNGVDLSRFRVSPVIPGVPWQLLFVGRLTRQKGVDLLLKALRGVPDVELHLVGDGEEREALQRLAGEQGVSVKFHGWVPDVTVFYEACHLVVLPSRWEGFGLVAVEAMASGRPVLGSSVDGLDDVLGSVGFRSVSGDVFSLRAAIVDALQDPSSLVRKGAAGPAHAARYDIRQTVGAYERLYRELL
jgi:glycosyltransferase involved in cell wall biosynthesis